MIKNKLSYNSNELFHPLVIYRFNSRRMILRSCVFGVDYVLKCKRILIFQSGIAKFIRYISSGKKQQKRNHQQQQYIDLLAKLSS